MNKFLLILGLLLAGWSTAQAAPANVCATSADAGAQHFQRFRDEAYVSDAGFKALTQSYAAVSPDSATAAERLRDGGAFLAARVPLAGPLQELAEPLRATLQNLADQTDQDAWTPRCQPHNWQHRIATAVQARCVDSGGAECSAARAQAEMLGQVVVIAARELMRSTFTPAVVMLNKEAVHNEKMWRSYIYDVQFQWPWELAANDNEVGHAGFRRPPNDRVILLHPDVHFAYAPSVAAGSKWTPALTLQWYGRLWWDGYRDEDGSIFGAKGLALASTYADFGGQDSVGHGVFMFYRGYSLGATRHDDQWVLLLNVELMGKVAKLADTEDRAAAWLERARTAR